MKTEPNYDIQPGMSASLPHDLRLLRAAKTNLRAARRPALLGLLLRSLNNVVIVVYALVRGIVPFPRTPWTQAFVLGRPVNDWD
jgi:hypothetical protein